MRLLKAEVIELEAKVADQARTLDWYRAREHQQYLDGFNAEWVGQVQARQQVRAQAA